MQSLSEYKKIVVKVGTSTLTYENGKMNLKRIEQLVRVLSDLKNSGRDVVLVSSGAISVGVSKMGLAERPGDIPGKQAAAAVGQCALMHLYDNLFLEHGHHVGQVLLTRDAVEHGRKDFIVNTFNRLLSMGAIPVVNENDTLAIEEIEFGDNDSLSAVVAALIGADILIILSDIDGLYDSDPKVNPNAKLIKKVTSADTEICAAAGPSRSTHGTGGMVTKLSAARMMMEKGITTAIVNGENSSNISDILEGKSCGTLFLPNNIKEVII